MEKIRLLQYQQARYNIDGCQNQVRLVFRRDDMLKNVSHAIKSTFPQVIVMNRGAHYVNDTTLTFDLERNVAEIRDWYSKCDSLNMTCHFFWRTTVPGHPRCNDFNFTSPINDRAKMESWISNSSNYDNHTIQYHWQDYQHQNLLATRILQEKLGGRVEFLDAYDLNILRPDEHRAHKGK